MLLRNKRTGFVYSYAKVLANDPEFEVFEENPPVPQAHESVAEKTIAVPVRKRKPKKAGETNGTNAE